MGTPYTGTDSYPTSYTIPDDGDAVDASAVNVAFEALGDRTESLGLSRASLVDIAALTALLVPTDGMVRHVLGFGFYTFVSASTVTVESPAVVAAGDATAGRWIADEDHAVSIVRTTWPTFTGGSRTRTRALSVHDYRITELNVARARTASFVPYFLDGSPAPVGGDASYADGTFIFKNAPTSTLTQGISICIDPYVHNGARLASVSALISGAASHAGLTLTQASIGVFRKPILSNLSPLTLRAAADFLNDAQGSTAAYQANHTLTLTTDQFNIIDSSAFSYFVQIWNEFGSQSLPGLSVYGLALNFDGIADMRFP